MADKELEIPYRVMAISGLAKDYSAAAFQVEIDQCREVIAKLAAENNRSDQQCARYRILRYLDLQLARSASWVDKERPSSDQEELTWKMASKLIHPSSHVINEFKNTMNDPPKNQFFALQILMYGWGIITIFHDIVWTA